MTAAVLPLRPTEQEALTFQHLKQLAVDIRNSSREAAASIAAVASKLAGVKTMYPQYFNAWVKTELQWPMRLVAQYLRIDQAFHDIDWTEAQADAQALMVLTSQYSVGGEQAITAAREVLQRGELLTAERAKRIKHHANTEVNQAHRPPPQRQQYIQAYPVNTTTTPGGIRTDRWVALTDIQASVMNLQVALIEAYGDHLHPQVRRALSQLQELVGASGAAVVAGVETKQ